MRVSEPTLGRVVSWGQRFILGLVLLGVGGVAPLTYFTPFSPHELPAYYISILEPLIHGPLPAEIRELLNIDSSPHRLTFYPDSISSLNFVRDASLSFQFNLSHGYLLPVTQGLLPVLFLTPLVLAVLQTGHPTWLPLPDEPPRPRLVLA